MLTRMTMNMDGEKMYKCQMHNHEKHLRTPPHCRWLRCAVLSVCPMTPLPKPKGARRRHCRHRLGLMHSAAACTAARPSTNHQNNDEVRAFEKEQRAPPPQVTNQKPMHGVSSNQSFHHHWYWCFHNGEPHRLCSFPL